MCRLWMTCTFFPPSCPCVEEIPKCHQDLIRSKLLFDAWRMLRTLWPQRKWRKNTSQKVWHTSRWSEARWSVRISQRWDYRGWGRDCAAYIVFLHRSNSFARPPSTWWSSRRRAPPPPLRWYFDFTFPFPVYHTLLRSPQAVTCSINSGPLKCY